MAGILFRSSSSPGGEKLVSSERYLEADHQRLGVQGHDRIGRVPRVGQQGADILFAARGAGMNEASINHGTPPAIAALCGPAAALANCRPIW